MSFFRAKPQSFAIGPYNLDMSIVGLERLVEITPTEYKMLPKTFKGEKIFKVPDVSFLGLSWTMMLGVVEGNIYKISPSLMLQDKSQADEVAMILLVYCKSKLGEAAQQQTGSFVWRTSDGNVILENLETPFGLGIGLNR